MGANNSGFSIEDNVLKGRDVPYVAPEFTNIGQVVLDRLGNDEDFVGLVDPVTDEKYTYRTMRERSVRCALWMRAQGVRKGDVVAICSDRKLDTGLPCFAALYIGAVFNPLDPEMNIKDFAYLLNIMKPKMAFTNEDSATMIAEAATVAGLDVKIVVFGRVPGFFEYEAVIAEPTNEEVDNFRIDSTGSPDETACILCSSGTTGLPKGVALSHRTFFQKFNLPPVRYLGLQTCMVIPPIYWISGTAVLFISVFEKMLSVVSPLFEEHSSCAMIEKYKVNFTIVSPNTVNRWLKSDALSKYDLSSVRVMVVGGSSVTVATQEALAKYLHPHSLISVAYGATEAGGVVSMMTNSTKREPGLCGHIADNVQLKVVDPVTNKVLGANETGELVVKSHAMMNGYYNNPQATAETIDAEGWLHTGDLGYYDEDGDIYFVERLKEMLKFRGHHISPVEVENVLLSHPGVKEAIVVGLSHPEDGEIPVAFVVRLPGELVTGKEVTETELIDLVASQLSESKRLRGGVRFVDSLPKSPADKILRKIVREMAKSMVKIQD